MINYGFPDTVKGRENKGFCERSQLSMLWYVWGRNDAGEVTVLAYDAAQEFYVMARNFAEGRTSYLPAVQDAYRQMSARQVAS